jgi:hypothetical protein
VLKPAVRKKKKEKRKKKKVTLSVRNILCCETALLLLENDVRVV